jgi:phage gpG-like protein
MPIRHQGKSSIERIKELKAALQKLPTQVANTALNHFQDNFKSQSWEGKKWKARSGWAVRNEGRAILHDTGTLQRALTQAVSGNSIRVFVAAPAAKYADIHNEGGTITIRANEKTKKWAWAMYYQARGGAEKGFYKAIALKMQSGRSLQIKIPQRKFIGHSPKLEAKIKDKIEKIITKIWNQ